MTTRIGAVVLAAGFSSRMGQFKPLLPVGETTAVEAAVNCFRRAAVDDVVVVTGHRAEELAPLLHRLGATQVFNPDYQRGMYTSVRAGIAALPAGVEACFLLPADIPLVRPATVAHLAGRYRAGQPPIIYPLYQGHRGHPPLIARSLFGEILADDGQGGLRALLERFDAEAAEAEIFDRGTLLDMDTPMDYQHLVALAASRHVPSDEECAAILAAWPVPEAVCRHGRAVAAVAERLAQHLADRGLALDRALIRAGSLLHDIAKGQPHHAEVGAAIVAGLGFGAVADVVRRHMDLDYRGGDIDEAALVFLADKLVREDRVVALQERFAGAMARFRGDPAALEGARRKQASAEALLAAVEARAGTSVAQMLAPLAASCELETT